MKRNFLIIVSTIIIALLIGSLFYYSMVTAQGPGDYDPWYDLNDDGLIDMRDIGGMARKFGTSGTPINKTALILELQQNITVLREEMIALQHWVGYTVIDMIYEVNETIEARVPQHEVISIPAAAFTPQEDHGQNFGTYLVNWNDSVRAYFHAPVQLPHGVNVTRVYSFWYDDGTGSVGLYLWKCSPGSMFTMAILESPLEGGPGRGSSNTNNINDPIIDNYNYYILSLRLPPRPSPKSTDYAFYYAIIEYEYPA